MIRMRDGQSLFVRVVGTGTPVLMLHGMGMNSRHWLPFLWPYRDRFRFYLPDFRGAGKSRSASYTGSDIFQTNAEDVQDIVTHFQLRDFLLVGYSLGASVALHWLQETGFPGVRRYLHIDQSACVPNKEDWTYGLYGSRQQLIFSAFHRLSPLLPFLGSPHLRAVHQSYLHAHDYRAVLARCDTPITFFYRTTFLALRRTGTTGHGRIGAQFKDCLL